MAERSLIEWTDASWTPIRARNRNTGKLGWHCEHATTGCAGCYAEGMNRRLGTGLPFKPGHRKDVEIFLDEELLLAPLRWAKPRMIFVCSMTDLFADFVTDEMIDRVFAVAALYRQHTFQVLTKRADRMRAYMTAPNRKRMIAEQVMPISCAMARVGGHAARIKLDHFSACFAGSGPFPNIWLGVSAERQQEADERIPDLLATPAAVRFVSLEPLIGPINLTSVFCHSNEHSIDALAGRRFSDPRDNEGSPENRLDWVIVGGESGPKARSMHPTWPRSIRDQCAHACIAFFFKQWGEYAPFPLADNRPLHRRRFYLGTRSFRFEQVEGYAMVRLGKKGAGRKLDGREHNALPQVPA